MLRNRGIKIINYLDDFLILSDTKTQNWLDLDTTINLLTILGFDINWDKVSPPTQKITFLGIHIDAVSRSLALPVEQITELKHLLLMWLGKKRCKRRNLLSLLGRLNWACRVIMGGRTFVRCLIDLSKSVKHNSQ